MPLYSFPPDPIPNPHPTMNAPGLGGSVKQMWTPSRSALEFPGEPTERLSDFPKSDLLEPPSRKILPPRTSF